MDIDKLDLTTIHNAAVNHRVPVDCISLDKNKIDGSTFAITLELDDDATVKYRDLEALRHALGFVCEIEISHTWDMAGPGWLCIELLCNWHLVNGRWFVQSDEE